MLHVIAYPLVALLGIAIGLCWARMPDPPPAAPPISPPATPRHTVRVTRRVRTR